jgi:transcriptional regulator with XRE-family HTH domain
MGNKKHKFRRWREQKGLTLEWVANHAGVTIGHISLIERHLASPSIGLADRLCRLTRGKVKVDDFLAR